MEIKNILLVQFRTKKLELSNEKQCILRYLGQSKLKAINAFNQEAEFIQPEKMLKGIDGVILGGSAEFNFAAGNPGREKMFWAMVGRMKSFLKYLLQNDVPTLGICFGHQFLGYTLGTKVITDKVQKETGSFSVFLTKEGKSDLLFSGFPSNFIAQFGHKDSLEKLPPGAILLAKTKRCKVATFRYKNNIYGVQFHPELTLRNMLNRLKLYPDYAGKKKISEIKKKLKPSPFSQRIFKNFLRIIHAY